MFRLSILLLPLVFSMGCLASGIKQEENSLIFLGTLFLAITGMSAPYIYIPTINNYIQKKTLHKLKDWIQLSKDLGLRFHLTSKTPTIYGTLKDHSVSISTEIHQDISGTIQFITYKIPVFNPKQVHLSFKDSIFQDSKESFFSNSVSGISENPLLESRFTIKTNSEYYLKRILQNGASESLLKIQEEIFIEVLGSNLIVKQRLGNTSLHSQQIKNMISILIQFTENFESNFTQLKSAA